MVDMSCHCDAILNKPASCMCQTLFAESKLIHKYLKLLLYLGVNSGGRNANKNKTFHFDSTFV